jgi:hypothetical protein
MDLLGKIKKKQALVGIIGLGYVGLPLVLRFCQVGFSVLGFDTDGWGDFLGTGDSPWSVAGAAGCRCGRRSFDRLGCLLFLKDVC